MSIAQTFFHVNRNNVDQDHFFSLYCLSTDRYMRIGENTKWASRGIAAATQSWCEYVHGISCKVVEVDYRRRIK